MGLLVSAEAGPGPGPGSPAATTTGTLQSHQLLRMSLHITATAAPDGKIARRRDSPRASRRGLLELTAISLGVIALVLYGEGLAFLGTGARLRGELLLVALPFLWMAPLWLLMPRRPRPAAPPRAVAL
jgi:hypothetical protein